MSGRSGRRVAEEVHVSLLREAAGSELDRPEVGAGALDVLQVGEDEPVLEPVEKCAREPLVSLDEVMRDVVVGIEHDLKVPGGEALEKPGELLGRPEDVLHRRLEREDRAGALGSGNELRERFVEQSARVGQHVVRRVDPVPFG